MMVNISENEEAIKELNIKTPELNKNVVNDEKVICITGTIKAGNNSNAE